MCRISSGREFQTDGPATENASSPNLVKVGGAIYNSTKSCGLYRYLLCLLWLKVDGSLPTRSSRVTVEDGNLTLDKIRGEDHGKYECVASNIVTRVVTATQLIVERKSSTLLSLKPRLHDTTGCPTGLTTGWTTGCIV